MSPQKCGCAQLTPDKQTFFDALWQAGNSCQIEIVPTDTVLWHSGNLQGLHDAGDGRPLWTNRDPAKFDDYVPKARDLALKHGLPPAVRLLLKPSRPLAAANFGAKSLLHITAGKHKEMQELLFQWLVLHELDAAVSSGGDAGEVIVARPCDTLVQVRRELL